MTSVPPRETRAPRIGPLAALPVFFKLEDRRVAVAGHGAAMTWKAELLAAAGARVDIYTPETSDELALLAEALPAGRVAIVERAWRESDLEGATLAIGALAGDEARAFAAAARRQGVPVNIVDTPHLSTFSFGTVVTRGPVTIGIGTDGIAPVLGQAIRAKIEALLHPALGAWAEAGRRVRDRVSAQFEMGPARREAWGRFATAALGARRAPEDREIDDLILGAPITRGSVALVGAGPGDPELLTLKALRALGSADVILHDRLVSPEALALARREATRILVGKTGGGPHCRQDDINGLMIRLAAEGKRVVRLKGGDPLIFGRAAEEIAACRAANIPIEVVPGITAALGAAAELLLPLTDRKLAKRLEIVAGHSEAGQAPEHDWPALADPWATTVFYMGARTWGDMLPKLLAAGLDPATPALAVAAATTSRRSVVRCAVADLDTRMRELDEGDPRLIVIGRVVATMDNERVRAKESREFSAKDAGIGERTTR